MPKLIITMSGTSALFNERTDWQCSCNGKKWKIPDDLIKELENEAANKKSKEYDHQKSQTINTLNDYLERYYENEEKGLQYLSAELASLLAMEKDEAIGPLTQDDKVVLFYSDTLEGRLCAEANKEVMERSDRLKKWNVEIIKINNLQTKDAVNFVESGLKNLFSEVKSLKDSHPGQHIFINITGGYKGAIPVLRVQPEITW